MTAVTQGWLVAKREMRERARSRGFRISSALMLLLAVVMVVLPGLLDTSDTKSVGISGATPRVIEQTLSSSGDSGGTSVQLHRFDSLASGEEALRDEKIDVLVVEARRLEWRGRADAELQALVTGAIQVGTVRDRAAAAGVDPDTVAELLSPVPVESVEIGAAPGRSRDDDAAATLMTGALLAAIVIYGNLVLTGVVEEKSSRVVEVLLARLPARALLGGKVVGIGLLGFGQLAVTAVAALVASMTMSSVDLPAVTGGVLAWVLVWFVLGYALYAMIYGALGSLASRTEDAQAVAGPVGYVLVVGLLGLLHRHRRGPRRALGAGTVLVPGDGSAGHARADRSWRRRLVGVPPRRAVDPCRDSGARQLRRTGLPERGAPHRCRRTAPRRLAQHAG